MKKRRAMEIISSIVVVVCLIWLSLSIASTGALVEYPKFKAFSTTGKLLAGGKLYSYYPYSSTKKDLYSNKSMTTKHTNPVVLDAYGEAAIWGAGPYKLVLKTSADVTLWSMDYVNGIGGTDGNATIFPELYGAVGDGTTDDTAAIEAALTACPDTGCRIVLTQVYRTVSDENMTSRAEYVFNNGGKLDPDTGTTVTFPDPNKIVARPDQELFTGAGLIKFTDPGTIYVDWWGPAKDGTTDDYAKLDAAHDAAAANSTLVLGAGTYLTDSEWLITTGVNVTGVCGVSTGTTIKAGASITSGSVMTYYPTSPYYEFLKLSCFTVDAARTADNALEIKGGYFVEVDNVIAGYALKYGHYINAWGTHTLGAVAPNAQIQNIKYVHSRAMYNGSGFRISNNGNGMGMVFALENCHAYYNDISVEMVGDNITKTTDNPNNVPYHYANYDIGFRVGITGGTYEAAPKDSANYSLIPVYGIVARNGVTFSIEDAYIENYLYLADGLFITDYHYWLSQGSYGHIKSTNSGLSWYARVEDNSTLCMDAGGVVSGTNINNVITHVQSINGVQEPFCVGARISDKHTWGPMNWPVEASGGYAVFKGQRMTDAQGTRWVQLEANDPGATPGTMVYHPYSRWSPIDGRIVIPFDYTTLNQGNTVLWFAQTDFVVTAMDVIVTKAFTSSQSAACGHAGSSTGSIALGNVPHRERFMSDSQLDIANLVEGAVIRAWDNDNATARALGYAYTSTSTSVHESDNKTITTTTTTTGNHKAKFMKGYNLKIMTDHPSWSDNATLDYENSYVMFSPCPYTGCLTCDGVWTAGEGFLVITGYPLEYN